MRPPPPRYREPIELALTPMIDVVFLLLVFFLWTSSFEEPEYDLPGAIASSTAAAATRGDQPPAEVFDEIVIRVIGPGLQPGRLQLNGQEIDSIESLVDRLRQIAALGAQPAVIVDPDSETAVGRAIAAYDAARAAGFDRVLLAARSEDSQPR